ncbi:DnaD domain protein [Clostridium sp. YIM B02505]|uniref:DnaD domain protein n=1 Tax=Clostridium yunnanense TaxID=2800325 RepID=A0ABS1ELJ6_9CLOT|nr:DnaD domain protein [Clostridium yunnanense]MBK1810230.1 DnaD domain protein [Clostridium yunnanense]
MAYRLIYEGFWTDPRTMEEMSPEDRFFYLYLLTNPSTTSIGIYVITKKKMAFELGYSVETIESLMERFINHHKVISYNKSTREIAIKNWGKHNLSRGGKPVIDCITKELKQVKDKSFIAYIAEHIQNKPIKDLFLSFCDVSTNREVGDEGVVARKAPNTERDTDTKDFTNTTTDREKEKYTEDNTEANPHLRDNPQFLEAQHDEITTLSKYFEAATGVQGTTHLAALKMAISQHGSEYVKLAMDKAIELGKPNMSYINGILKNWSKEGYPMESEISKSTKGYGSSGKLRFADYEQRDYDYEDLEQKLLYGIGNEGEEDND